MVPETPRKFTRLELVTHEVGDDDIQCVIDIGPNEEACARSAFCGELVGMTLSVPSPHDLQDYADALGRRRPVGSSPRLHCGLIVQANLRLVVAGVHDGWMTFLADMYLVTGRIGEVPQIRQPRVARFGGRYRLNGTRGGQLRLGRATIDLMPDYQQRNLSVTRLIKPIAVP